MKGLAVDMFCPSRPFTLWGRRLTGRLRSFTDLKTGTETRFDFTWNPSSAMLGFKGQPHQQSTCSTCAPFEDNLGQNSHTRASLGQGRAAMQNLWLCCSFIYPQTREVMRCATWLIASNFVHTAGDAEIIKASVVYRFSCFDTGY